MVGCGEVREGRTKRCKMWGFVWSTPCALRRSIFVSITFFRSSIDAAFVCVGPLSVLASVVKATAARCVGFVRALGEPWRSWRVLS